MLPFMSNPIVLPTSDELVTRIRACREELVALKKLYRLAMAAQAARKAGERGQPCAKQSRKPRNQSSNAVTDSVE
jgi:hypothetical protein